MAVTELFANKNERQLHPIVPVDLAFHIADIGKQLASFAMRPRWPTSTLTLWDRFLSEAAGRAAAVGLGRAAASGRFQPLTRPALTRAVNPSKTTPANHSKTAAPVMSV